MRFIQLMIHRGRQSSLIPITNNSIRRWSLSVPLFGHRMETHQYCSVISSHRFPRTSIGSKLSPFIGDVAKKIVRCIWRWIHLEMEGRPHRRLVNTCTVQLYAREHTCCEISTPSPCRCRTWRPHLPINHQFGHARYTWHSAVPMPSITITSPLHHDW